jgi:hypothetical protein
VLLHSAMGNEYFVIFWFQPEDPVLMVKWDTAEKKDTFAKFLKDELKATAHDDCSYVFHSKHNLYAAGERCVVLGYDLYKVDAK